jgi:tetratricopeptide (TPR) repeat protein
MGDGMKSRSRILLISAALLIGAAPTLAADTAPKAPDKLSTARARIAEKNWQGAIDELKAVNDPGNADWNNLMGYSMRKQATPDYAAAEKYYNEALRIDPKHRGALEYSGELYLMKGDLVRAEQRLQALGKECRLPCEEQQDLEKAIARFKADGNRYKPAE